MKLSFSTLGCPRWGLETVIRQAQAMGYDGLEFRGIRDQLDVTQVPGLTIQGGETRKRLAEAGLEVICFSSSVRLMEPAASPLNARLEELRRYAGLCQDFGAPFIRIFGGENGGKPWDRAVGEAAETLAKMIPIVEPTPAILLIETHDDWLAAEHFKALMKTVNSAKVGVLWDINHPFMFVGEEPAVTWEKAGRWISHVHWKDARPAVDTPAGFRPCRLGEGVLPHRRMLEVLKKGGYDGYLSLEWEKRWHPELSDPEIAFPEYLTYMRNLMAETADASSQCQG